MDLFVAVMKANVSVAIMQLEVSAALMGPGKSFCSKYVGEYFY